jgi:xylulokinase
MNFLGIDVGTSAVKAVLVDGDQVALAEASAPLAISHPRPGWSEQDPQDWWRATETVVAALRRDRGKAFAGVGAVGLCGQMHGAILLDEADAVIRPAILWNDGRATAECAALEQAVSGLGRIAGIVAMPGFTAPKLRWLRAHEPEASARMRKILLAKDYVRLRLTGDCATDMADAAGTLLLDEAARDWSDPILAAAGVERTQLPRLLEGSVPSGALRSQICEAWGLRGPVTVAAGAGDAAAAAIGIGAVEDGDSFVSLGTSAQFFLTRDRYEPKPETLIHAFAHGLPGRWFEMAAMLNGAGCIDWAAKLLGEPDVGALIDRVEVAFTGPSPVIFLPYLSGERTPHNDPSARGVFAGLDQATGAVDLAQAVLEGVAFSLADGQLALGGAAVGAPAIPLVGGGARSRFWMTLIAAILGRPIRLVAAADKGPAFGAARLARLAVTDEAPAAVCTKPPVLETIAPDTDLQHAYGERFQTYRALYPALKGRFG